MSNSFADDFWWSQHFERALYQMAQIHQSLANNDNKLLAIILVQSAILIVLIVILLCGIAIYWSNAGSLKANRDRYEALNSGNGTHKSPGSAERGVSVQPQSILANSANRPQHQPVNVPAPQPPTHNNTSRWASAAAAATGNRRLLAQQNSSCTARSGSPVMSRRSTIRGRRAGTENLTSLSGMPSSGLSRQNTGEREDTAGGCSSLFADLEGDDGNGSTENTSPTSQVVYASNMHMDLLQPPMM